MPISNDQNHGKLIGPNNCNKGRVLIFAPLMGAGFVLVSSKCRGVGAMKLYTFSKTRFLFQTPGIIAVASWFGRTQTRWNILDLALKCCLWIPLTISTTKRVNTRLIPSPVSWRIQPKKMDTCTSFCSKRACTVSCSGVPFGAHKSEMHFVVIYFGMRCVVPETQKPSFAGHALLHEHIAWTFRPFFGSDSWLTIISW